MKNFILLAMCIIMFAFNSILTIFRYWEKPRHTKLINLLLSVCFAFDILYFLRGKKHRLEIFDFLGFILPNMALFLNPQLNSFTRFGVEQFNPHN